MSDQKFNDTDLLVQLQSGTVPDSPAPGATVCVVVTYNSEDYIYDCLAALQGWDVLVVDNNSTDRTRDIVSEHFPLARMLHVRHNLGLSRAFNLAWRSVGHDIVLLLNPDVFVNTSGVSELVRFLRSRTSPAIVVPRLTNNDGSIQESAREFPTLAAGLARRTPLGRTSWGRLRIEEHLTSIARDSSEPTFTDWALGAAIAIPREILMQLDGYDDRYFLYCEDVDFCARAWSRGFPVIYYPSVAFTHVYQRLSRRSWNFASRATRAHLASTMRLAMSYPAEYLGWRPIREKEALLSRSEA
jgi:N-acetylglucosaminyl-diphospho-decaprenol L-rhamnosyltransferase